MGFSNPQDKPGSNGIFGYVFKKGRRHAVLSIRMQNVPFVTEDPPLTLNPVALDVLTDAESKYDAQRATGERDAGIFMGRYLQNRYAMKIEFQIDDPTSNSDPTVIPFTTFYPVVGPGGRFGQFPVRWEKSDLIPFGKTFRDLFRFNEFKGPFDSGVHWLFNGGASQSVDADTLDVNPVEPGEGIRNPFNPFGPRSPLPVDGIERVVATVRIVDLLSDTLNVVATFERLWDHDFEDIEIGDRDRIGQPQRVR